MTTRSIVVADIGGTHARFAIARIGDREVCSIGAPAVLRTGDYGSIRDAWSAYASMIGGEPPSEAAIAVAAPLHGESVRFTNGAWQINTLSLCDDLGLRNHILLNDFAAVAHAVDGLPEGAFTHLAGPDVPLPKTGPISVVGPGTGLGISLLLRTADRAHVVPTEGAHAGFAPLDELEDRLLAGLRSDYGRVSIERVVSGAGLRSICEALSNDAGCELPTQDNKELWTLGLTGGHQVAEAGVRRFCGIFGAVAGDVCLMHGLGATVIAGGLGQKLSGHFENSEFAERFIDKGRYKKLMKQVPVKLVDYPEPGLFGAAYAYACADAM